MNSNWEKASKHILQHKEKKRTRTPNVTKEKPLKKHKTSIPLPPESQYLAMDCEMVGVGTRGKRSVLARCSLVDYHGNVVYDEIIQPLEKVTDFRTHVSGIRSKTLRKAVCFRKAQKQIGKLLKDKILVGHALKNDFQALMMYHPKPFIRDTSQYRPYMRRRGTGVKLYPRSLKDLTKEILQLEIQTGEHDSVEDARCAMELFKKAQIPWERAILSMPKYHGGLIGASLKSTMDKKVKEHSTHSKHADTIKISQTTLDHKEILEFEE